MFQITPVGQLGRNPVRHREELADDLTAALGWWRLFCRVPATVLGAKQVGMNIVFCPNGNFDGAPETEPDYILYCDADLPRAPRILRYWVVFHQIAPCIGTTSKRFRYHSCL